MSYFPIRIKISETGDVLFCETPDDVPEATRFTVVETNAK